MTRSNSHAIVVPEPFYQPGYGLPVYRTTRPQAPPFLFFSGARYGGGRLVTNLPSSAAEKQKEKGCVGAAFLIKQATTNVVETAKEYLRYPRVLKNGKLNLTFSI